MKRLLSLAGFLLLVSPLCDRPPIASEHCAVAGETPNGSCREQVECPAPGACARAIVIGFGSAACEVACRNRGPGVEVPPDGWLRILPAFASETTRLGDLLAGFERDFGLRLRAPRLNPESRVTLHLERLPLTSWIGSAARQLRAVAVRRAAAFGIELIPEAEIGARTFCEGREDPLPVATFQDQDVTSALLMIARGGGVDLVVPEGLSGTVDGDYSGLGWRAAMEAVLRYSGNPRRVSVGPNGLAEIGP